MMPIFIDLKDKNVVIFGGGELGGRKAKRFLDGGCKNILIASKNFSVEIKSLRGVKTIRRNLSEGFEDLLEGVFIVVPATDDEELNDSIKEESMRRGILTNHPRGDLFLPSVVKDGKIQIAISTGGRSPALSKYLRLELEKFLEDKFDEMAELQHRIRKILMDEIEDQKRRKEILWEILDDDRIWGSSLERALEIAREHVGK